jgi:type IV pilus assembly protein PilF
MTRNKILVCLLAILWMVFLISCAGGQEKRKNQARTSRQLGEAYMHQGNYTESLKELLKAEKLYSEDHLLQNDLGLAYMAKKRFDMAELHFKKAIDIREQYAPAKNNLGSVYLARQDWDAAIEQFKTVVGDILYATPHFPLTNMGIAYYNKHDYINAEKYYLDALDLQPNFLLALRGLSKTYIAMNRLPQTVAILERAVKSAPESANLYLELGNAYHMSGKTQKALFAYRKVTTLSPNTSMAETAEKEIMKIESRQ